MKPRGRLARAGVAQPGEACGAAAARWPKPKQPKQLKLSEEARSAWQNCLCIFYTFEGPKVNLEAMASNRMLGCCFIHV